MHQRPQPLCLSTIQTPEQHPSHGILDMPGAPAHLPLTGVHLAPREVTNVKGGLVVPEDAACATTVVTGKDVPGAAGTSTHQRPHPFCISSMQIPEQHPSHGILGMPGAPAHLPLTGVHLAPHGVTRIDEELAVLEDAACTTVVVAGKDVSGTSGKPTHQRPKPFRLSSIQTPEQQLCQRNLCTPGAPSHLLLAGTQGDLKDESYPCS
jgi:hypothetical protein